MIQYYDSEIIETEERRYQEPPNSLFGHLSKEDCIALGASEDMIAYLKSFTTIEAFEASEKKMPPDVFEYFSLVALGEPVDEVVELRLSYIGTQEDGSADITDDFAAALRNPESRRSFVVIEDEEDLRRILEAPLETWRVFLHPSQRKIAENNYSGSASVLGGAGTGKTVVAMHRAKYLASQLKDDRKILFTTFTRNLAEDIKTDLGKICTEAEMRKIEVINLDAWAHDFLRAIDPSADLVYDTEEIKKRWERAITESGAKLDFKWSFYWKEWERIVIPQEALTLEKYREAKRPEREIRRLGYKQRDKIWKVFEAYLNIMKEDHIRDINMAMYECSEYIKTHGTENKYAHIIVDEGQDFSNNAFKLLRNIAGEERPNDIFIAGDSHQRIYNNYQNLSKCGINVKGRSSTLRINYRTTEETRKYAFALLNGISFDDMDDGVDPGNKCISLTHGEAPSVECFPDINKEVEYLVKTISELQAASVPLKNICIVARSNKLVKEYSERITNSGFKVYQVKNAKSDDQTYDGLRIATMHRVKGLGFQYIFIVSANDGVIPAESAIDRSNPVSEQEGYKSEKSLLYVALTRAQKKAYITCYGKKSEFI